MCILGSYSLVGPRLSGWGRGWIKLLLDSEYMPLCSEQPAQLYTVDLDILLGATVAPISQGRKMRSKESRTLAHDHREVIVIANTQTHILFVTQSSYRRWHGNATASLRALSRQCCLPHSSQSWTGAQDLAHLHTSYLQSLPMLATKPDTSGLFFAGSIMGGSMVEEDQVSFLLTPEIMQFTWHHTMVVIISHHKYKIRCSAELVKRGQELL